MKSFLRGIIINFVCILLITKLIGGFSYSDNIIVLIWASVFLSILNLLVKPILNLLLMPINLITLGAFRWIINVIVLFIVTIFVPGFKIVGIDFSGFAFSGFVIPTFRLSFFWSIVLVSFLVEMLSGVFNWIFKS